MVVSLPAGQTSTCLLSSLLILFSAGGIQEELPRWRLGGREALCAPSKWPVRSDSSRGPACHTHFKLALHPFSFTVHFSARVLWGSPTRFCVMSVARLPSTHRRLLTLIPSKSQQTLSFLRVAHLFTHIAYCLSPKSVTLDCESLHGGWGKRGCSGISDTHCSY